MGACPADLGHKHVTAAVKAALCPPKPAVELKDETGAGRDDEVNSVTLWELYQKNSQTETRDRPVSDLLEATVALSVQQVIFEKIQSSMLPGLAAEQCPWKCLSGEVSTSAKGTDSIKKLALEGNLSPEAKLWYWGTVVNETLAQFAPRDKILSLGDSRGIRLFLDASKYMDSTSSRYCAAWLIKPLKEEAKEQTVSEIGEAKVVDNTGVAAPKAASRKRKAIATKEKDKYSPAFLLKHEEITVTVPWMGANTDYTFKMPYLARIPEFKVSDGQPLFRARIDDDDEEVIKRVTRVKLSHASKFLSS